MGLFQESSLEDLYQSAVAAFPRTTKRQHATHPVVIREMRWTPFAGMKTLLIRGDAINEERNYSTLILFKNVDYNKKEVPVINSSGKKFHFGKLSLEHNDVVLRCNCKDFYWRFNYYNHLDKSLYGRKRAPYEGTGMGPPANPMQMEGMCKHLMKTVKALEEAGVFKESVAFSEL